MKRKKIIFLRFMKKTQNSIMKKYLRTQKVRKKRKRWPWRISIARWRKRKAALLMKNKRKWKLSIIKVFISDSLNLHAVGIWDFKWFYLIQNLPDLRLFGFLGFCPQTLPDWIQIFFLTKVIFEGTSQTNKVQKEVNFNRKY